ncbi:MAG: Lsm family RNA-binding protein [Candidatus Bathyarchaeota archaeon]
MADVGSRMFFEELSKILRRTVTIVLVDGRTYVGTLEGYNPISMSMCLSKARDDKGKELPQIFLNGNLVGQIYVTEKLFDLRGLASRLEKVFPRMVKLYDDVGIIVVMDKIRINANGILEGSGPAAERVQKVYDEFIKETAKA